MESNGDKMWQIHSRLSVHARGFEGIAFEARRKQATEAGSAGDAGTFENSPDKKVHEESLVLVNQDSKSCKIDQSNTNGSPCVLVKWWNAGDVDALSPQEWEV